MNEEQWLACADPAPMLESLRGKASDRKLRLFAVACCRRTLHLLHDEHSRDAVEVAERFADGMADEEDLRRAYLSMEFQPESLAAAAYLTSVPRYDRPSVLHRYGIVDLARLDEKTSQRVENICISGVRFPVDAALAVARKAAAVEPAVEVSVQADYLRCLFGPLPFREVHIDGAWRNWRGGTVIKLTQSAYEDCLSDGALDNDLLDVLADALEEAGCANPEILSHCRKPGAVHVRGCWALDAVFGKR